MVHHSIFRSCLKTINFIKQRWKILFIKRRIKKSGLFEQQYYLKYNPDVAESRWDPLEHYLIYGGKEGRNPGHLFNNIFYLNTYKDVKESGMNPLWHYIKYGKQEGRKINDAYEIDPLITKKMYLKKKRNELIRFLRGSEKMDFINENPEVSVILVLYNQAELTFACLKSLEQNTKIPLELIIVDNHSTDRTHKLLKRINVSKIIYNKKNLHFLTACNQALQFVTSQTVLFLNNDTEIEKEALANALKSLYEKEDIGVVGAKLILPDGKLQEAGNIIWHDGSCLGYGRNDSPLAPEYNFKRVVDYCSGAFLLTRTNLLKQHEGFDAKFLPAYYEETDYCLWLQENNLKVIYDPNVKVNHFEFGSSDKDNGIEIQSLNRRKFTEKHAHQLKKHLKFSEANILHARFSASKINTKKILYIEDRVPYPFLGSGYPRSFSIIEVLEKLGYLLTVYPNTFPFDEDFKEIYQYISPFTEVFVEHGIRKFSEFLQKRKNYYDLIWVTRPHNMKFCQEALSKYKGEAKIIYDAEAIFAEREITKYKILSGLINRTRSKQMIADEMELCKIADSIIAVSQADAAKFIQYGFRAVNVLGHSIKTQASDKKFSDRKNLLFVGNLDHDESPNVDSIIWFAKNVFPIIKRDIPEIKFHVVGSNKSRFLQNINMDGIIFHGKVDDLKDFYNNCRVFVAPTRFAAGIPYKVHEAASRGIPVVASELLVNQLGWGHRTHIISARIEPHDYAQAVISLYNDKKLWNIIRENSLASVKKELSEETFKQTIFNTVTRLYI